MILAAASRRGFGLPVLLRTPTFNEANGAGGDTFTIPTGAGVLWRVNGIEQGAGTYTPQPGQRVTITGKATEGYSLTRPAIWEHTFSEAFTPPTLGGLHDAIQALDPIGYWMLNDTSGHALDSSGYGRHGYYDGVTRAGADGFATFDGNARVTIQPNPDYELPARITVFALAKPTTPGTSRRAILGRGNLRDDWELSRTTSGTLLAELWDTTTGGHSVQTTATMQADTWQPVAARLATGTNPTADVMLGDTLTTSTPTTSLTVGHRRDPFTIGAGPVGSRWVGGLAHVAIFPGILTAGQLGGLVTAARTEGLIA